MKRKDTEKRIGLLVLAGLVMFLLFSAAFADDELTLTEAWFGRQESVSGWKDVPGRGETRYYAQNDALWEDLTYESDGSSKLRPFGDGGCNPTALAMAVRSIVAQEDLPAVASDMLRPFSMCRCSLNKAKCGYGHARYYLTTSMDYERFLPLVFADYACGNNRNGVSSRNEGKGTVGGYMKYVCAAYGLSLETVSDTESGLAAVKEDGKAVVAYCSSGGAFTTVGHYVFLAWWDDEYVYFLDPLCRTEYRTNHSRYMHILEPGLVYMRRSELKYAGISGYIIISK